VNKSRKKARGCLLKDEVGWEVLRSPEGTEGSSPERVVVKI
jgi:hypothetical protein